VMSETPKDESTPVDKNTKEQYEELGRFVVAFEDVVNDVRELCIFVFAGFNSSQQTFVSVAFHHRVLTAQPLFEIMQTLIAEVAHFAAQLQDARKISERVPRRAVGELKVAEIGSKPQTDT
jgi:hypothetical protein